MALIAVGRRRIVPASTTPPTLSSPSVAVKIFDDGAYNAFPGAVTCPNGDILVSWVRKTDHVAGGTLYSVRSTDGGATWGAPAVIAAETETEYYGTATLSAIDNDRIALVSWVRSFGQYVPYADGTRIFVSNDNGLTWAAPLTVSTGADWLRQSSRAESPLVYKGGWYYLGVLGLDTGSSTTDRVAGIMRSEDLETWTRVALFDTPFGWNECGVADMGTHLVYVVRCEGDGHYSCVSKDGLRWSKLAKIRPWLAGGAPKLATAPVHGANFFALRGGVGSGTMVSVDSGGYLTEHMSLVAASGFLYAQACTVNPTTLGVAYSWQESASKANIYWRTYTVTAP